MPIGRRPGQYTHTPTHLLSDLHDSSAHSPPAGTDVCCNVSVQRVCSTAQRPAPSRPCSQLLTCYTTTLLFSTCLQVSTETQRTHRVRQRLNVKDL